MKVAVAGAAGTLGAVAVPALLSRFPEWQVRALVRSQDAGLGSLSRCEVISGGVFDSDSVAAAIADSDIVVNLAARNPAGQAEDLKETESFVLTNGLGAAIIARTCAEHRVPLLHFSSVAVYETGVHRPGAALTESEPLPAGDPAVDTYFEACRSWLRETAFLGDPALEFSNAWRGFRSNHPYPEKVSVYGLTKLLGESLSLELAKNILAVRMCDVYGPGHESRGVVIDHLMGLLSGSVTVDFDYRSTVSYIYIDDVIEFFAAAIPHLIARAPAAQVMNLAGEAVRPDEFGAALASLNRGSVETGPISVGETFDRRYATTLQRQLFPAAISTSLGSGLGRTLEALTAAGV